MTREELERAFAEWKPRAAVAVVLDLEHGRVLAQAGRDAQGENAELAASRAYVTGSTLKVFTIAAALEANTVRIDSRFDCAPRRVGQGEVRDGTAYGVLSLTEVLVTSSNVGTSRVYDTMGLEPLLTMLHRVHLDEAPGRLPEVRDPAGMDAVMLAIGESAEATPLSVARGYAAVFNDGLYHGYDLTVSSDTPERVMRVDTARALVDMLEAAVVGELATGKLARIEGLRVAGKTGTAQLADGSLYASFVGTVLERSPRLLVLVGLEAPTQGATGPSAAAPLFARVMRRLTVQDSP